MAPPLARQCVKLDGLLSLVAESLGSDGDHARVRWVIADGGFVAVEKTRPDSLV
jgi:hypothetical protein